MAGETEAVVFFFGGGIPDHAVRLAGFLESGFRLLISGMVVGVVVLGELSKGRLDLDRRRVLLDAQHLVIVFHWRRTITFLRVLSPHHPDVLRSFRLPGTRTGL